MGRKSQTGREEENKSEKQCNIKVREEGGGGGGPAAKAEISLQTRGDHAGADINTAVPRGPHGRAGAYFFKELQPVEKPTLEQVYPE